MVKNDQDWIVAGGPCFRVDDSTRGLMARRATITRVTATQVIIDNIRYSRRTLRRLGDRTGRITSPDDENAAYSALVGDLERAENEIYRSIPGNYRLDLNGHVKLLRRIVMEAQKGLALVEGSEVSVDE